MIFHNIPSLFFARVAENDGRNVFFYRQDNAWHSMTWNQFGLETEFFAAALIESGLATGGTTCILMGNVPQWPIADVATILAGGVGVGLYPTSAPEQCRYIIDHSEAQFVVVDTRQRLDVIESVLPDLPNIRAVIALCEKTDSSDHRVIPYREFLALGEKVHDKHRAALRAKAQTIAPDETAIMVYTSGTTGLPKGACLSHRYVLNSVASLQQVIPLSADDRAFSFLPYCHVAERISGLYNRMYAGVAAYFVDDPARLGAYMREIKPTVFPSLPRFFEKIHARVVSDLDSAPTEEREAFGRALELGRAISRLKQENRPIPDDLRQEYETVSPPAITRLKSYFGGEIRMATSGGAPLPLEIAEFFDALGLPILQAYGLTENVCVAFNTPHRFRFGTVGPLMPGCEGKIAEDGEILIRSNMMFSGYFKDEAKTAEMFRDGWLATGDLGEFDSDGFLKITGRKKELIITSTGKNIAPALIENLLKEHHLISHAMVYGDGKSYLVALLTLNSDEAHAFAQTRGLTPISFAEFTRHPEVTRVVDDIISRVNARVSSTEAIKRYVVLDHDFSVDDDEVTPTMKIKRNVIAKRYSTLLESLYS